jgi:hypothetical protein
MATSLLINFDILTDLDLTVEEFLVLYKFYKTNNILDINLESLEQKQFIKRDNNNIVLRHKAKELIELCEIDCDISYDSNKKQIKKSSRIINNIVENRIEEFRNKWRGLKTASMGDPKACREKMIKWMTENPQYDFDQILKAVDIYLATEGNNIQYLQRADYFIYKAEKNGVNSRLSAYIEEIDTYQEEGWTNQLK